MHRIIAQQSSRWTFRRTHGAKIYHKFLTASKQMGTCGQNDPDSMKLQPMPHLAPYAVVGIVLQLLGLEAKTLPKAIKEVAKLREQTR